LDVVDDFQLLNLGFETRLHSLRAPGHEVRVNLTGGQHAHRRQNRSHQQFVSQFHCGCPVPERRHRVAWPPDMRLSACYL
jgi:hypothetical protein